MRLNTLRYLDRFLGIHICNGLYLFKKLFRRKRIKEDIINVSPKKILLIKIWGIGSVILLSPMVPNLRKMYPDAEIHLLTKKGLDVIYEDGVFDKVHLFELGKFFTMFRDFTKLIWEIFWERYDLVIDLEVVSRFTAILTFLTWSKFSIGYEIIGQNKDKLYDANVIYHESKHITEIFCESLQFLECPEIDYSLLPPFVPVDTEEKVLQRFPLLQKSVIVNCNTSDLALERRWPREYFVQVIQFLQEQNIPVLLIGGPDEREYVQGLYDMLEDTTGVENIAGKITLRETFALIKNGGLFISNDSGPLHVAVAFQVPTISFFGPETPLIYGPRFHSELHKVFFLNLYCSPCISVFRGKTFVCKNSNNCMKKILPSQVIAYIQSIL